MKNKLRKIRDRQPNLITYHTGKTSLIFLFAAILGLANCQTRLPNLLSPAPRAPVQTADLPPLANPENGPQPIDPNAPAPPANSSQPFDPAANVNNTPPPASPTQQPNTPSEQPTPIVSTAQLSRADMLGAWTITSSEDSCQLFMTLTTWTGGYRATTKGCNTIELANITAWDLKEENQIILVGATGTQTAMLTPLGGNRFSGQTQSGVSINVSR